VKSIVSRFYRWWRALNHQGLVENTFKGYDKNKRAEAIGLLIAAAPMLPLMVSDTMGLKRGWLWYGWSAIAIAWGVSVVAVITYQTGKTLVSYYRN
jgi:hypothetical protein